ncbi:MAG: hypothetical protein HYU64_00015 [Armatimonadetes bacterium]|nr:hypothetical protein [Armatimonadota bacterium]
MRISMITGVRSRFHGPDIKTSLRPSEDHGRVVLKDSADIGSTLPSEEKAAKEIVNKMLTSSAGFLEMRTLTKAARKLGLPNMEKLLANGVRIAVHRDDPFALNRRLFVAEYDPVGKVLRIAPRRLSVSTVLHELGHALDDVLEPDKSPGEPVLKSGVDSGLKKLYKDYCERTWNLSWWNRLWKQGLWSDYATENEHEYLAEGIMFFARGPGDREKLHKNDEGLWEYVRKMMAPFPFRKICAF